MTTESLDHLKISVNQEQDFDFDNLNDVFKAFHEISSIDELNKMVTDYIKNLTDELGLDSDYVFLFDDRNSIGHYHSNEIYNSLNTGGCRKNIFMIIHSHGGSIEPAYLISKACKRLAKERFVVAIPRQAKSAATLISLGADEIHMGALSELGPIDPQINGFPALGLSNAMEKIAQMSSNHPGASDILARYLIEKVDIEHLGYYERINESAVQYAERLLSGKESFPKGKTPSDIANHLTNHYKDHSFVIDSDEAFDLLGKDIVKMSTQEYELSNKIYEFLRACSYLYETLKRKKMRYIGSIDDGLKLDDIKQ